MRDWRPTAIERQATRDAIFSLRAADSFWRDDMHQAALLALWRTTDRRDRGHRWSAYLVAASAATDELRRVTGVRRAGMDAWVAPPDVDDTTPESLLRASQAVRMLDALPEPYRAAVEGLVAGKTRRQVAAELGIDASGVTHLLEPRRNPDRRRSVRERLEAAV